MERSATAGIKIVRPMPRSGITIARLSASCRRYAAFIGFCWRPLRGRGTTGHMELRSAPRLFEGHMEPGSAVAVRSTNGYSKASAARSQRQKGSDAVANPVVRRCCDSPRYWRHVRSRGESQRNGVPMPRSGKI